MIASAAYFLLLFVNKLAGDSFHSYQTLILECYETPPKKYIADPYPTWESGMDVKGDTSQKKKKECVVPIPIFISDILGFKGEPHVKNNK